MNENETPTSATEEPEDQQVYFKVTVKVRDFDLTEMIAQLLNTDLAGEVTVKLENAE